MKLQTRTTIRFLMKRIGCENVNQFGIWVNCESVRLGWKDTHNSNKWRKLDKGTFIRPPVKPIQMLSQLFNDAAHIYLNGPSNLWKALWGDAANPDVLWPLCRTRFSNGAPWLDDTAWEVLRSKLYNERTFYETIREFEGELLLALAYEEPLTLNHLTEAIALYRLHQITNTLTISNVDGAGAYRCIRICLDNKSVYRELQSYRAFEFIHAELVKMERFRLAAERSYRNSIGIEQDLIDDYVDNPLTCIEEDDRWRKLNFDWVCLGSEAAKNAC